MNKCRVLERKLLFRLGKLRKPKVQYLHDPVITDHDVLGLDIAVNDSLAVRRAKARSDLGGVLEQLIGRESSLHQLSEGLALDQLRRDERTAVDIADLVDGEYVRMIEG